MASSPRESGYQVHDFKHLRDTLSSEHSEHFWNLYDNKTIFFPSATKAQLEAMHAAFQREFTFRPPRFSKFTSKKEAKREFMRKLEETARKKGLTKTATRKRFARVTKVDQKREYMTYSFPGGHVHYFKHTDLDHYFPGVWEDMGVKRMGPLMTLGSNPYRSHEDNAEDFMEFARMIRRLGIEAKIVGNGHVWHINPPKRR
ncbi:hypothetical protein HYV43_07125 [Candidatus Micrarchaeota archaeon]|nr:hypothetical protein [Candidatus Micrarchaeota archaeon]